VKLKLEKSSSSETEVVCLKSAKRRKITETHKTAKKARLTIPESRLDSPDINEDEVQTTFLDDYEIPSNVIIRKSFQ
jgi:hypothetical protein